MSNGKPDDKSGKRGGGFVIPVFVFGQPDSVKPVADDKFDVTIALGQNYSNPAYAVMVKVTIQDTMIDVVPVREKKAHTFKGLKLDLSKPIEVRIEKAGDPKNNDKAILPHPPGYSKKTPAATSDFEVQPSRDPDNNGFFRVRITSNNSTAKVVAVPDFEAQGLEFRAGSTTGATVDREKLQLVDGVLILFIKFSAPQININFFFDNGKVPKTIPLVYSPAERKRFGIK